MTVRRIAASLVAPNIFDAYADQNLLLYLVMSNLLSPATWDFSARISARAEAAGDRDAPSSRALIGEIQRFLNRNFQHLHNQDVARLYGELDIAAEKARLGDDTVEQALRRITQNLEGRLALGPAFQEALTPMLARIRDGAFPAYFYGNIDVVRANRRATGKPHASVKGLTCCVDEAAMFAALVMTMPVGTIAQVVGLAGPSHTSAFGWNADGEAWWFHSKNRLYFAADWRDHVASAPAGDAQASFDALFDDFSRIVSAAGTFNFETGEANLPDDQIDVIAAKMDQFFGTRLRQLAAGLSRPRQRRAEDPLAPYLRSLVGSSSIGQVLERLGNSTDEAHQGVLYAFRSLSVADLHPYVAAALAQPNCRKLAVGLRAPDDAVALVAGITETGSVLGSRDRVTMPDETLRFGVGTDRDKALLLLALFAHMDARDGRSRPLAALLGEHRSFVQSGDQYLDVTSGQVHPAPAEPILYRLA